MLEITSLGDGRLGDVIDLYNYAIAQNRYSGRLDEETWQTVIATKPYFTPQAVLIAYERDLPLGFVHLCNGPSDDRTAADPAVGSIEGLFFDPSRRDVGDALLREAVSHHRTAGATKVLGWSSFSGYPLYRGIFVGLEPMAMEDDHHVVRAFLEAGFDYCQHSVEMAIDFARPVEEPAPAVDVAFRTAPWQSDRSWEAATWQGLAPYRSHASVDGEDIAFCLYAIMPVISATQGTTVGCIGGLGTHEPWRRKGIAAFLVAKALNHLFDLGARRVTLGTQHDNWAAHATYRRLGMEIENRACAFVREPIGTA